MSGSLKRYQGDPYTQGINSTREWQLKCVAALYLQEQPQVNTPSPIIKAGNGEDDRALTIFERKLLKVARACCNAVTHPLSSPQLLRHFKRIRPFMID